MNLNNLNIRHLYYFWIIAKEGSIKSASLQLNLTQPTISDQLKQFEEVLGRALFTRKQRRLSITRFGEEVLVYADKLFSVAMELVDLVNNKEPVSTQNINIGIVPTLATNLIYHLIYPLIHKSKFFIRVKEGEIDYLNHELELSRLDLIITGNLPHFINRNFETKELFKRSFQFVCGAGNQGLIKNFPKSIHGFPFINFTKSTDLHYKIEAYFQQQGIRPNIIAELDEVNLIQTATENGVCVSMLPLRAIEKSLSQGTLFSLKVIDSFSSSIFAIMKKNRHPYLNEAIQIISQQLKESESGDFKNNKSLIQMLPTKTSN